MKYRRLDANGDYTFGHGSSDYLSGIDALRQAVETKIKLFYGEWFANQGIGIPMFQSLLGQVNIEQLKIALQNLLTARVLEVKGVQSVEAMTITQNDRELHVSLTLNTTYGDTTLEVM